MLCGLSGLLLLSGYGVHALHVGPLGALAGHDGDGGVPPGSIVAYLGAVVLGAWFVLPKAWGALRRLRPDMNLLMVVAILGAVLLGEWFEGAAVAFLFSLALLLESWSVGRARRAIERLLDLSPPMAHVRATGEEAFVDTPVENVPTGSLFSVRPGERVPLDGEVVSGQSSVNEAPLTGESMPVTRGPGDPVFAGTINADAALVVRSTRVAEDSALARIIHMVEEAQSRQAPSEQWVERFALRYTPIMMALAIAVAVVPPTLGFWSWTESFYRALVLLVIACPCALVISTPVSIVAALAAAARAGVLVKGGAFLESAAHVRALALDKTGTLTRGKPVVERLVPLEGHTELELMGWAAAMEARSNHPLARAIVAYAKSRGVAAVPVEGLREIPGKGAECTLNGRRLWIGGHRLVHERVAETAIAHATIAQLEVSGLTAVALGDEEHVCGVFGLADEVRPESHATVEALREAGIEHVVMLTGDHERAAERVALATGLDDYRASLLPEDKVTAMEELARSFGQTAMIGDGVNDAPALATAGLGIAMGAIGSDVAIETADIALMSDDLARVPWLIGHAKRTLRVIRQNVALALGTKALVMLLASVGAASLWMAIAADMGTSLLVIANALRLLRA